MPAESVAQQQLMGADLERLREGKKTRTGMTEEQLEEFAGTKHKGLPERKGSAEAKTSRELLREKIQRIADDRRTQRYGRLAEVAAKEPRKVAAALGELAEAASVIAASFASLRENLDLAEAPRAMSVAARIAARQKFAAEFRRVAEQQPEALAEALSELYHSIDEIASGIENLASNMGIELAVAEEEGEGAVLEELGESLESPAEQAEEEETGTEGTEADKGQDVEKGEEHVEEHKEEAAGPEKEEKKEEKKEAAAKTALEGDKLERCIHDVKRKNREEGKPEEGTESGKGNPWAVCKSQKSAAGGGESGFVTDRDEEGDPKEPKKASGGAAFTTDRDQQAEPKSVEKAEVPESQGHAPFGRQDSSYPTQKSGGFSRPAEW